ncbi:LysR family transcriptional regulator [Bradyrhizobium sp. U87765 SZCCT0131]|uniref:LysR family transcriptional regulator n=1 Tax=unclassified Bradyrhizobium TaxID=2631580 RepID=UPI001BAD0469|nr:MULTISPECIES: LysR family transcriptional regulator [unclassified Bradyrhizobium]MBR1217380.1 LysR family transcriptional regulator [Bradyrhizobium sp. U87765 SZCCT0131]MBR1265023.1 LysR family transcriptional regulator [Bradyrhizobium sp. U87765 SZCCT0134]MBR1305005.1 LysR family transcriptional regulator [Bradyrhizobium sp. U87765 SZCCT0110]MBR1320791.1 LysR family transcriptional regulator [Bradyrhizobium sp. U87765 SZCCT0109]MBR1349211.1 LysR family transcriptional regulator [Bradyrhizo
MPDWEDLRHFAAFAREGTLSAAARALGVDHATVARRIVALEASTGLKLVDRRARTTTLTDDGRRIATAAAPMEEAAFAVGRAARAAQPGVDGEVTISAPPTFASAVIAPRLIQLRQRHPGIRIKLIGEKRRASLSRREADVALRLLRPVESGLFVRRLGSFGFSLYATPAYLKDTPPHAFAFIGYDATMADSPQEVWLRTIVGDREVVLRTNDLETQIAAARSGLGIAALPHYLGDGDACLQRHAVTQRPIRRDVWLLVHRDLRQVPAVRAVMTFLGECMNGG